MIRRFRQVFGRYADHHVMMKRAAQPLQTAEGRCVGWVDQMQLRDGRIVLDGWADGQRVTLSQTGLQTQARTAITREDVRAAHPELSTLTPGFTISLPYRSGPVAVSVENGPDAQSFVLDAFATRPVRRARRRLILPFLARVAWALPLAIRMKLTGDPTRRVILRQGIKDRLGLRDEIGTVGVRPVDFTLFSSAQQADAPEADLLATPITIVVPVYNAFDLLQECLDRVVRHTDLPWHLVVIEDCSTDAQVRPWLSDWVARINAQTPDRVTLIENGKNLGFIRSVNSGFAVAMSRGDHVVLLNSDALVPRGWASRLIRPLLMRPNVATVTPMSNDAEIFGAPVMCMQTPLLAGEADAIDAVAASFDAQASLAEAPTGVGFCMAMHSGYLRKIPQFDTVFGRGYGEEVDWCQKARAMGGVHLGLGQMFVEHRGGQSFGGDEKRKSIQAASKIVSDRYPLYDNEVQDFVRHDPLHGSRLVLALAFAVQRATQQGKPLPVYMAHSMGGGAEHYLQRRIAGDIKGAGADTAVVLRVGGAQRWQIDVHTPDGVTRGATDDMPSIRRLLASAAALHIVYSNGVGDPDPVRLPKILLGLKRGDQDSIEVQFHDFYPLTPSFNLLSTRGRFEGVPAAGARSPAHETRRPDGSLVKLSDWRDAWGALLRAANEVRVFSQDGAAHVRAAYPEVTPNVVPHALPPLPPRLTAAPGAAVIGVLGNIGLPKGAEVLQRMGDHVPKGGLALIGNIDPAYDPGPNVPVHGDYRIADLETLVARYRVGCWLIPSICPETFSYTTQECLATGLPVWCFDVGAQAEAVRAALDKGAAGGVLPYDMVDRPEDIVARLTKG